MINSSVVEMLMKRNEAFALATLVNLLSYSALHTLTSLSLHFLLCLGAM